MEELYGGSLNEPQGQFENSMAGEIEKALNDLRAKEGMDPIPLGNRDRRMLFIAIARGVINHLKNNEQAFQIHLEDGTHTHDGHPTIGVKP
ncbi:MAG: hypothetical protein ACE5JP_00075 [Candidatus Bipolaricaulia bacterium]